MPAYIIADIEVVDAEGFADYRAKVPAVIAAHGGHYLARGGAIEVLEGGWPANRIVILEFSDMAALKAFWDSPDYAPLKEIREKSARCRILAVEGTLQR